jgi:hypothetical protein
VTRLTIEFDWDLMGVVATDAAGRLVMPAAPDGPGLYRFWAESRPGRAWVHVGETADLQRRLARYVHPRSEHPVDVRINRRLIELVDAGSRVMVWTITDASTRLDAAAPVAMDLRRQSNRMLVESAATLSVPPEDRRG